MIKRNLECHGLCLIMSGQPIIGCNLYLSTQVTDPSRQVVNRSHPHRTFRLVISVIASSQSDLHNSHYPRQRPTAPPRSTLVQVQPRKRLKVYLNIDASGRAN